MKYSTNQRCIDANGFTLVELLAVLVVILLLVGILIASGGYIQKKVASQRAKAEIRALELAIESYKIDNGVYPSSTVLRVSRYGEAETGNSAALYRALAGGAKKYIQFRASQLQRAPITNQIWWYDATYPAGTQTNIILPLITGGITNYIIRDPWKRPYNYYCTSPLLPTATVTNLTDDPLMGQASDVVGGQVNLTAFDLMSYGPDMATYSPLLATPFNNSAVAVDDINNFQ